MWTAAFLLLAAAFIAAAACGWSGRAPRDILKPLPGLPIYLRQPPWWAVLCAGLAVASLHLALHSRFSMLVFLALIAGMWFGVIQHTSLVRGDADVEDEDDAETKRWWQTRWWESEIAHALAGGACVAAAVYLVAKVGSNPAGTFASVTLVIYGLLQAGRWMGSIIGSAMAQSVRA
jgi:hypothetical protein